MRRVGAIAAAAALVAALAACAPAADGADAGDEALGQRGEELIVQFRGAPMSLDPALQGTASGSIFTVLAYDPLIYQAPDGSLQPALATEWEFTDDDRTVFELTLRDGVQFASGKPLTAESVVASMEYFLSKSGPNMSRVGPIETIEAVDDDTVRITYSAPFADAPMSLTQTYMFGNIIGPDGVADPASLLQTMDGAGQYVYSPEASVPDSEYVYELNPTYWNPDAQMWDRVKVEIISDPNAVLNAAATGQIDFGLGSSLLAESAEAAGLEIVTAPFYNWGLRLVDVNGEINPALADVRVRTAIGLAIDRESIVNALGGEYMAPSDQIVVEGADGYNPEIGWEYDLDRARELMAEAGYEDGFSMTILDSSLQDQQSQIAQAIASALGEIGIDVKLEVDSTSIPSFIEKAESKQFEAILWATNGTFGNAYADLRGVGSMANPFGFVDEEMERMYAESLGVEGDERQALYERMGERWQELAITIPVLTQYFVNYVGPKVTNVQASAQNPVMLPVGPQPEYSWQPAG
ncbi:ABC transporter substrate-binding protein [Microbacterium sp.]|uniref:ABC transporter substrate-binding protein n=1 Tax=Microbacterium sp. TaxID=51671 RepID=UPI002CF39C41|nr:ABC transporter substrate-binding protein [Microbacterium sp.]HWL77847.1 ABC transporter substrate-binding protein [Microbacterium sp.]